MSKIHIPEHQWRKQKRKQRLKGKRRDKKKVGTDKFCRRRNFHDDDDDRLDPKEWQDEWKDY